VCRRKHQPKLLFPHYHTLCPLTHVVPTEKEITSPSPARAANTLSRQWKEGNTAGRTFYFGVGLFKIGALFLSFITNPFDNHNQQLHTAPAPTRLNEKLIETRRGCYQYFRLECWTHVELIMQHVSSKPLRVIVYLFQPMRKSKQIHMSWTESEIHYRGGTN